MEFFLKGIWNAKNKKLWDTDDEMWVRKYLPELFIY